MHSFLPDPKLQKLMKKRSLPKDEAAEVRLWVRTERKAGLGDFGPDSLGHSECHALPDF